MITDKRIDGGKPFDWGLTSDDYARFRDIYPDEFYERIVKRGLCVKGQNVLDIGTGTGVLPRNMYKYGASWTGTDIAENQIKNAVMLSEKAGLDIKYLVSSAENLDFPDGTFDIITACQCFFYFNHEITAPIFSKLLKNNGRLLILYMAWLPYEDEIAGKSEEIILKYNPDWSGAGETMHPIFIPDAIKEYFDVTYKEECDINVPFTRESWNGRIRACRGIGASLSEEKIKLWEAEHTKMLSHYPESFEIKHYMAMAELRKK